MAGALVPQCVTWLVLPHVQRLDLVVVKIASLDCGMAFTITELCLGCWLLLRGGGVFSIISHAEFQCCLLFLPTAAVKSLDTSPHDLVSAGALRGRFVCSFCHYALCSCPLR